MRVADRTDRRTAAGRGLLGAKPPGRSPTAIKPRARSSNAGGIWLISFTDLTCLMLAFFVLKLSMSEPIEQKWRAIADAVAAHPAAVSGAAFNTATLNPQSAINLDYLATLLSGQFAGDPDLVRMLPVRGGDRMIIGIPDDLLFEADQVGFSPRGQRVLFILGGVLGRIGNRIEVTGHAALEPVASGPKALTGWELALGRTVAVAIALRESGYGHGLVARSVTAANQGQRAHLIDLVVRDQKDD